MYSGPCSRGFTNLVAGGYKRKVSQKTMSKYSNFCILSYVGNSCKMKDTNLRHLKWPIRIKTINMLCLKHTHCSQHRVDFFNESVLALRVCSETVRHKGHCAGRCVISGQEKQNGVSCNLFYSQTYSGTQHASNLITTILIPLCFECTPCLIFENTSLFPLFRVLVGISFLYFVSVCVFVSVEHKLKHVFSIL